MRGEGEGRREKGEDEDHFGGVDDAGLDHVDILPCEGVVAEAGINLGGE
jgi:hypothetical protein